MRHPSTLKAKSKTHEVTRLYNGVYCVVSGATGNEYFVSPAAKGYQCTCDWAKYRPVANNGSCGCSHVIAVVAFVEAENKRTVQAHSDIDQALRQHRTILDIGDGLLLTTRKAG